MPKVKGPKTAGILIVGDEILSGKTEDTNSKFLATELRALGVDVRRISVIPDDVDVIAEEVSLFSRQFDYVFTSGGVGPTHDDMTIEGIAKGFGLRTETNSVIAGIIDKRCGGRKPAKSTLKMAELPESAVVIMEKGMGFPVISVKNVFIFPGIPSFLRNKFGVIKERFRSKPYRLKKVFISEEECFIAGALEKIVAGHPDVSVGSYPYVNITDYKVMVTLESINLRSLNKAFKELLGLLPGEVVVRTQ